MKEWWKASGACRLAFKQYETTWGQWLVELYDHFKVKPSIINNGFRAAGIVIVWNCSMHVLIMLSDQYGVWLAMLGNYSGQKL